MSDYLPVDEPMGGPDAETQPSRRYMGNFVSLRYVSKAISRRKRLWVPLAVVGLLVGMSLHEVIPSKYTAQTELLMISNPNDDPTRDMATDVALLESEAVAQQVVTQLKLNTTAQKLTGQYAGVATTDEVLQITFSAPTASEAIARANTLDNAFLQFRASVLTAQNDAVVKTLQAQVDGLEKQSNKLQNQMGPLSGSAPGTAANAEFANLQNQLQAVEAQITPLTQAIQEDNLVTVTIIGESRVIANATAITHSKFKVFLTDGASGLVAGIAIGLGIITVAAIVSDRIRQRDEVASALGAPVELSVGRFGRMRVLRKRRLRRRLSRPGRPVELMSRQLRAVVQAGPSPKRLAVVSVDSLEASALSIAILAGRLAVYEGSRVMVVDLSPGRVLGELLGVTTSETRIVFVKGAWVPVLVSVPPEDDLSVEMPAPDVDPNDLPGPSWTTPQVVLALTTLDPGMGAGHLSPIADEAYVVVTAGRSSAPKVSATAEMLRAAGLSVLGGILVGADDNDESLGFRAAARRSRRAADGFDDLMETSFASASAAEHH